MVLIAAALVAACQTLPAAAPPSGNGTAAVSQPFYSPLYDRADHLADLIAAGDLDGADHLYIEQQESFDADTAPRTQELLNTLATRINARHETAFTAALANLRALPVPIPATDWPRTAAALKAAVDALNAYPTTGLLADPARKPAALAALRAEQGRIAGNLRAGAAAAFLAFDHGQGPAFADAYPLDLDMAALVAETWGALRPRLAGWDAATLVRFGTTYERELAQAGRAADLGALYAARVGRDNGIAGDRSPLTALALAAAAKRAGLVASPPAGTEIALVEATSQTLLRHGQIDFPVGVDIDLPVKTVRSTLEATFGPGAKGPRLVIVLDVALAKASRRVSQLDRVPSVLFLPAGGAVQFDNETDGAQASRRSMTQVQGSVPLAGNIPGHPAVGASAAAAPVFFQYSYERARITARKTMTVNYYLVDRRAGAYVKSTFDIAEQERFEVVYNIARADTRYRHIIDTSDSEGDVDDFEKASSAVALSQILLHSLSQAGRQQKWRSLESFYGELTRDKNTAIAAYKDTDYAARPLNDPRFDSVVAIYTGPGSLGTGFYVQPDVVLTNWHVVDNRRIVELRKYDGTETFGSVLGKDVRLDLALIRVQSRGRPVAFRRTAQLDIGAMVEGIGHPHRKEFSVTRGVVSAIREEYSINLPNRAGDKVLYVQTDAAINPGNSGGPLFLGDTVIGVNTWGYAPEYADNLSFAIHYGEVLSFLNEHLPGFAEANRRSR
jgi:serine protease Do